MKLERRHLPLPAVLAAAVLVAPLAQARKPAPAAALQGVVTQVIDGDSLQFTPTGQAAIAVRLRDIDAPEICQLWGPEARKALAEWVLNKPATLRPLGKAGPGYTVGTLLLDGADISVRMVEEGHAWSTRGRSGHGPLLKQERMAHVLARGLHSQPGAVMPQDFLRSHGPC